MTRRVVIDLDDILAGIEAAAIVIALACSGYLAVIAIERIL